MRAGFVDNGSVRGVVFDFDGTLTVPGAIDFAAIRRDIGCPDGVSILQWIDGMVDETQRQRAQTILRDAEERGAAESVPRGGAEAFIGRLRRAGLPLSIVTRNSAKSLAVTFSRFTTITAACFNPVVTRDDPFPPKPHPASLLEIARRWTISPEELFFIGDYRDDVATAQAAGAISCWIPPDSGGPQPEVAPDYRVSGFEEIEVILKSRGAL